MKNIRERGEPKPETLVAVARNGQARAMVVPDKKHHTLEPTLRGWIEAGATLATVRNDVYARIGAKLAEHSSAQHQAQR